MHGFWVQSVGVLLVLCPAVYYYCFTILFPCRACRRQRTPPNFRASIPFRTARVNRPDENIVFVDQNGERDVFHADIF